MSVIFSVRGPKGKEEKIEFGSVDEAAAARKAYLTRLRRGKTSGSYAEFLRGYIKAQQKFSRERE